MRGNQTMRWTLMVALCGVLVGAAGSRPALAATVKLGDVVVADIATSTVHVVDPGTGAWQTVSAGNNLSFLTGVTTVGPERVIASDFQAGVVEIDPVTGSQQVLLDAAPSGQTLYGPTQLVTGPGGVFLISDAFEGVVRIGTSGANPQTIASGTHLVSPVGIALEANGDLLVVTEETIPDVTDDCLSDGAPGVVRVTPGTGAQVLLSCGGSIAEPTGIAIAPGGEILVSDLGNGIVAVDPVTGAQSPFASGGSLAATTGVSVGVLGDVFASDEDLPGVVHLSVSGTELGTFTDAALQRPFALAVVVPEPGAGGASAAALIGLAGLRRRRT